MPETHVYLAPAAAGKTAYAVQLAQQRTQHLTTAVRVCVASQWQVRAWHERLAAAGGALGVYVFTFDKLITACLDEAGEVYTELSEPVRYRLLRTLVGRQPLTHFAPLRDKPGFIQALQQLINELKESRIQPPDLAAAVAQLGDEPRLHELAHLYEAYQQALWPQAWADLPGLNWLAVEALAWRAPRVGRNWPLLIVDGFDDFTPIQLALLGQLSGRVAEMIILLTGTADGSTYPRFRRTRERVEEALGVTAVALPDRSDKAAQQPALRHLVTHLGALHAEQRASDGRVHLVAAADRAAEVRAALRWLKARLVHDRLTPTDVALLARDTTPYRPFIWQTAVEFGLPIRLADGLPLAANPAVAALLDLLRLALPNAQGEAALPRRQVLEAWRSPYFDWQAAGVDISAGAADRLARAAQFGRVIGGLSQWQEAFDALRQRQTADVHDEESQLPTQLPAGAAAATLQTRFNRFYDVIRPPRAARTMRDFVLWLEQLIGPDPEDETQGNRDQPSLRMIGCVRDADEALAALDLAALIEFKHILGNLLWAEQTADTPQPVDYPGFLTELTGVVDASFYRQPPSGQAEIFVANVPQARGLSFRAVAVLGLAEGVFPAPQREDPFLRDADREALNTRFDMPLAPSTQSTEQEFFYEALARATDHLLLTRPRLAETGAEWLPSPFWERVCRLVDATPVHEQTLQPGGAASWPELLEAVAAQGEATAVHHWLQQEDAARWTPVVNAGNLLALHDANRPHEPHNGHLAPLAATLAAQFGPTHTWSASRLETYRTCGYYFFISHVLRLEPQTPPQAGLDAAQLGSIYHEILELIYRDPRLQAAEDTAAVASLVTEIATPVLDKAPRRQGFRQTAWWQESRRTIIDNVVRTVQALAEHAHGFRPVQTEARFWGDQALHVGEGEERFALHGFIDRVDRDENGRVRIIDYKLGGPSGYTASEVAKGKKLQLPLYALAAQEALGLGEVVDGFYWHVQKSEPSSFTLATFDGGVTAALETAVAYAHDTVHNVRTGEFRPLPPDGGCPNYCPAAAFCWHYDPGYTF